MHESTLDHLVMLCCGSFTIVAAMAMVYAIACWIDTRNGKGDK